MRRQTMCTAGIFDDRKSFFDGVIDVIKFIDIPSCAEAEASDQAWVEVSAEWIWQTCRSLQMQELV